MRCFVMVAMPTLLSATPSVSNGPTLRRSAPLPKERGRLYSLQRDLGDGAGTDRAPALPNGETRPLLQGDRGDQLHLDGDVVARHDHLFPLRQDDLPRHVRRPNVELGSVAIEERRVPPPLLLGQPIHLRPKPRVRPNRPRPGPHLPPLDLVAPYPPQQAPPLAPPLPLVQP